jgi:hypothetical protein
LGCSGDLATPERYAARGASSTPKPQDVVVGRVVASQHVVVSPIRPQSTSRAVPSTLAGLLSPRVGQVVHGRGGGCPPRLHGSYTEHVFGSSGGRGGAAVPRARRCVLARYSPGESSAWSAPAPRSVGRGSVRGRAWADPSRPRRGPEPARNAAQDSGGEYLTRRPGAGHGSRRPRTPE